MDERDRNLGTLLHESVRLDHPLSVAREVAAKLEPRSARELESLLRGVENDNESADRLLMVCARAAELAAAEEIRGWALIQRGFLAERHGLSERAGTLVTDGFDALDRLDLGGDETLRRAYGVAGDWLFRFHSNAGRPGNVRKVLAQLLRHYQREGDEDGEWRAVINLLSISLSVGDLGSAMSHADRLIDGSWRERFAGDEKTSEAVRQLLHHLAAKLYEFGDQGREPARRIASNVQDLEHPDGGLLLLLATTAFDAGDQEEALVHFDQILSRPRELLPDYEVWRLHLRKAICLAQLGREPEALEEIQRAIRLAPSDPYVRYAAAQIHGSLDDLERSIAALSETARLATERMEASDGTQQAPRVAPMSSWEYRSNVPIEDLRDFALTGRAKALRDTGDTAAAEADLRYLVDVGDETIRPAALGMLADWAEEDGKLSEAADLLRQAIGVGEGPDRRELLLHLARVELRRHSYEQALGILQRLCHKSMLPEEAAELLGQIPPEHEIWTRALKWRGYAKTEAGWPQEGLVDLDAAIEAEPDDAEAYYLRALTRITQGIKGESAEWNGALTMKSIREAMVDLYAALKIDSGHGEARRVLQWLAERAAANPDMYEIFTHGGTREGDLFRVFPELRAAFRQAWEGNSLGYQRDWTGAANCFLDAQERFRRAGFLLMVKRMDRRLADVYLRQLDMAKVAEHLAEAESLQFLVDRPLSADVIEQYEDFVTQRGPYEKPTLGREVEYAWIYDHTYFDTIHLMFVRANYRHRIGDLQGALEDADLLVPILEDPSNLGVIIDPEQAIWIVAIFRDAERYEEALKLLDALESGVEGYDLSFKVAYSRALILDAQGESPRAVESHERALALLAETQRPVGIVPFAQYAGSLQNAGRASEAAEVLQKIDLERDAESDRDRLIYDRVAAYVYRDLDKYEDALAALERAVAIVEQSRAHITDPIGRRGWLGNQENLFALGVDLYAEVQETQRAWELCELSKSRTLLDELEGRGAVSEDHAGVITALDSVEKAIGIVDGSLTGEGDPGTNASLRVEAIATLSALLTPDFDRVRQSKEFDEQDFDGVRKMLEERRQVLLGRELELREQASTTSSDVVDLAEVRELLTD